MVITISRQLGSLGDRIARTTAARLGYRLVYRELINQAARRAGAPEMALAVIDDLGLLGVRPTRQAKQAYQQAVHQVIVELAAQGNVVIVGRAGSVLLRDCPDALHVRILAPLACRIRRVACREAISPQAARARIEASDQARRDYLYRYHQVDWADPELYDLIINTEKLTAEAASDLICLARARHPSNSGGTATSQQEPGLE